jgi:hypothetical protein
MRRDSNIPLLYIRRLPKSCNPASALLDQTIRSHHSVYTRFKVKDIIARIFARIVLWGQVA